MNTITTSTAKMREWLGIFDDAHIAAVMLSMWEPGDAGVVVDGAFDLTVLEIEEGAWVASLRGDDGEVAYGVSLICDDALAAVTGAVAFCRRYFEAIGAISRRPAVRYTLDVMGEAPRIQLAHEKEYRALLVDLLRNHVEDVMSSAREAAAHGDVSAFGELDTLRSVRREVVDPRVQAMRKEGVL